MTEPLRASCDGCGCWTGARHVRDCTRAVCEATGLQWLDCSCPKLGAEGYGTQVAPNGFSHQIDRYQGEWVFDVAARTMQMFVRWNADALYGQGRWERCLPNEVGAGADLNRIVEQGLWVASRHEWRRRRAALYVRLSTKDRPDFDVAAFPLRLWALEAGMDVVVELQDVDRIGKGWKAALGSAADVIIVNDQADLGASNAIRRKAVTEARDAGRPVLSRKMWDDQTQAPLSARLRWSYEARAAIGPEPD